MKHSTVYWLTCVLTILAIVPAATATTIVMPSDDALVSKSPLIVTAMVVSSEPVERDGRIWTESILDVEHSLKGNAPSSITVREIGGTIGEHITKIWGAPEYTPGERVLAFLTPTPRGDYQTMDLLLGKFSEAQTLDGEKLWLRDESKPDHVTLLDATLQPIETMNTQRDAAAFERFIEARANGRTPVIENYTIENPVIDRPALHDRPSGPQAVDNFTLLSEPTVYRWSVFDNGGAASWYSSGTQPGYTGGGVAEIQSAMDAWNSYTAARIHYAYAGAETSSPGGMNTRNGRNEIMFNDPLGDIAGTWNPRTGGVVGLGGFNAVGGSTKWTSPFGADATHTQGTFTATSITEANLTIQDNVSSQQGISSKVLAEIVAHEFGHTLGFGHSADSTALMYATVTGLGASLRADDQVAARWLYPSGSATPPPTTQAPAAPTSLNASGSTSTISLQWADNSTNESGFYIYMAPSTGAFSRVVSAPADRTVATLSGVSAGTYRLYVTAFNSGGESAATNIVTVTVAVQQPSLSASFSFSPSSPLAGNNVSFLDQSAGSPASWAWSFGDGSTSSSQNPVKQYTGAGTYAVTLTVSRSGQSSTTSRSITVTAPVPATPPATAAFGFAPSNPTAGTVVTFNDASTGSPTRWNWVFGDGSTSPLQNPTHAFLAPGTYTVSLTVTNSVSSNTTSRMITVASVILPFRSLVSVAAQTNGAGGSVWRTELTLFNGGSDGASVQLTLLPPGGSVQSRALFLSPRQAVTYNNVLLDVFGISNGSGALAIEATSAASTPALRVSSRTFTNSPAGTYGQAVPDVPSSDLQRTLYLTGLESDASYRTNIGIVNSSNASVPVSLRLIGGSGNTIGTASVTIGPNTFRQDSLATFFPAVAGRNYDVLSMRADLGAASAVSVYASVVDNRTQDPVYVQGAPLPSASQLIVPNVGHTAGGNGTFWRSDLTLFNTSGSPINVYARFFAAGADNRNAVRRPVFVGAGQTVVVGDLTQSLGFTTNGVGALELTWDGSIAPVIASRTYTTNATGGTYGQSVDLVSKLGRDAYVVGLRSDLAFRSNLGFVNAGDQTIGVNLTLLGSAGQAIATGFVALQPKSQFQASVAALFPQVNVSSLGTFTLQAHTDAAATLFAYGSIVDNVSGDPVFFGGK